MSNTFKPHGTGTTVQRDALTPGNGWTWFNTDNSEYQFFNGSIWVSLTNVAPTANLCFGTYVGDGTDNRTIAHGCGLFGVVTILPTTSTGLGMLTSIRGSEVYILKNVSNVRQTAILPVTGVTTFGAMEETSFRVGSAGSLNNNTVSYTFIVSRF